MASLSNTAYRYTNPGAGFIQNAPASDDNAAYFTMTLYKSEAIHFSFTFYVTPEQIEISVPSRMAIYQTIAGNTFIDHLGEGITSIKLNGNTGYRLGGRYSVGFGYASYQMLRYLVNQYNDLCRQGLTSQLRLVLHMGFPDSADFGTWDVTIQELQLSRNASQPLIFRYGLSLLCLTTDQLAAGRQIIDLSKLKSTLIGEEIPLPATQTSEQQTPQEQEKTTSETFGLTFIDYTTPELDLVSDDNPNTLSGIASKVIVNGVGRINEALGARDYNSVQSINQEIAAATSAIYDSNPWLFTQVGKHQPLPPGMILKIPITTARVESR